MSLPVQVKYIVISLLFVLATINFTKTALSVIRSSKRLDVTRKEVAELESQKSLLAEELKYKQTPEFVEQEARNKLNMAKPGEKVFINPGTVLSAFTEKANVEGKSLAREKSNVFLWLDLFF